MLRERWRLRGGALASAVDGVAAPAEFDDSVRHVIGDWADEEEPAASLARQRAEAHVHHHLERAAAEGRQNGTVVAALVFAPLTAILSLIFLFSL